MKTLWNISELSAQTALALSGLDVDQESGRVSQAPSARTIRFYTTHGLMDRPAEFRGRTALYSERHLLQLVAIKTLQAKGRALSDIQEAIVGATESELRNISGLLEASSETEAAPAPAPATRGSFWKEQPAAREVVEPEQEPVDVLPAIRLAEGVTLVLETDGLLDHDLDAIQAAAAPLIALLQKRRIVRPKP